jgi:hypothetical protein
MIAPAARQVKRKGYVPFNPPEELKKLEPGQSPIVWEQSDDPDAPVCAGFLDSHSERFPNRKTFEDMFAKVQERLRTK